MQPKVEQKQQARALREQGVSLNVISRDLGIAKSTASLWCRDIRLTDEQVKALLNRPIAAYIGAMANKHKRQLEIESIRRDARHELLPLNPTDFDRLKDLGTMLYWAEGGKKNGIDFTNSDPEMIRLAMLWLREVCQVPEYRFRATIYYHSGQNEEEMKRYWSRIAGIPLDQFRKSIFKQEGTGHRKQILYMGTCKIRVSDSDLLQRVLAWIEQFHLPV